MNQKRRTTYELLFIIIAIGIYSCKYYVNPNFRQTYTNINEAIHSDSTNIPFFKIHFKNGDVSVLDKWNLNTNRDSILGKGRRYDFNRKEIKKGNLSCSVDEVAIIETNQLEAIKSKDNKKVAALAILTAGNISLDAFCLSNPKACFGSCPTFYIDGKTLLHSSSAEGFSSSISPALEVKDLDALQHSISTNEFFITMKNEALETHLINQISIDAVPKKKHEHIYHDKYGKYYTCKKSFPIKNALVDDKDISEALSQFDDNEYFSPTDSLDLTTKEKIILEFENLPNTDLGIVINFRQTLLTTFLLYSGISYMGNDVGDYFSKIETNKHISKRAENPFERLGKIEFSVWDNKKKKWKPIENLYETGPIAKNLVLVPILKTKAENGKLKIKVELAKGLWRLDYLGLTTIHATAQSYTVFPKNIEIIDGENYSINDVRHDDNEYLVSFPGNEFRFEFEFPKITDDNEYELFLSSKGYYLEWIRREWLKGKDIPKLRRMLLYNPKTWRELAIEFKTMEDEMESVFWNSKYSKIQ